MSTQEQHRTRIERRAGLFRYGSNMTTTAYVAKCSCGWESPAKRRTENAAEDDAGAHVVACAGS